MAEAQPRGQHSAAAPCPQGKPRCPHVTSLHRGHALSTSTAGTCTPACPHRSNSANGSHNANSTHRPARRDKKAIATKVLGTVKWYNVKHRYGFITINDTKEDVFIHQTAIKKNNPRKYLRSVGDGETVEFDIIQGKRGPQAANVTGPGGIPVLGSRYAPNRNHPRQHPRCKSPPCCQPNNHNNNLEAETVQSTDQPPHNQKPGPEITRPHKRLSRTPSSTSPQSLQPPYLPLAFPFYPIPNKINPFWGLPKSYYSQFMFSQIPTPFFPPWSPSHKPCFSIPLLHSYQPVFPEFFSNTEGGMNRGSEGKESLLKVTIFLFRINNVCLASYQAQHFHTNSHRLNHS